MSQKRILWVDYIVAVCAAAVGVGLLTNSAAVSAGIQNGLRICAGVLIPSLFPFMVLSSFLSLTSAASILSIPLTPITTRIFKLPKEFGAIVLLSLVGGYPVGAKSISLLLEQGRIEKSTAERMLCFCMNSGPSFLITAVGVGMLFSKTAGLILFFSQTVATLIIGMIVSFRVKIPTAQISKIKMKNDEAFVAAVSSASSAMIAMCSFAILFSGITALISANGTITRLAHTIHINENIVKAIISGILEVTSGCVNASAIGGLLGFGIICAAASFGGLSVLFQVISCFRENPISFRPLIFSRILHMCISTAIAFPIYSALCEAQMVFATSSQPVVHTNMRTVFISVCLLCMCAIMTLSCAKN